MKASINGIELDWCLVGDKTYNSDVTTHAIDDNSADSIASHVNNNFMSFSLQANIQGDDRDIKIEKLLDIRKKKQLVEFSYFELLDRLVITSIVYRQIGSNTIQVDISFTQIQYATLKRTEKPLPSLSTTVKKKSKTGKQGTTEKKLVDKKLKLPSGVDL